MPKPTKLHNKGKPNSIQKPVKKIIDTEASDNADPEESIRQFQLELCWCIQQLEKILTDKKANEKQLQETWKVLTVLKNNNQPIIRKRQLMRTHFGDYRSKMAAEEKKLTKMASKMKITETKVTPKATFLRKSAFLTTGDESFRFDFNLTPDQLDNSSNVANNTVDINNSNTQASEDGNTVKETAEDNSKSFKFTFSESGFKFNFNNS